jgi:YaiO family outer membrane protein
VKSQLRKAACAIAWTATSALAQEMLPVRVEMSGYGSHVTNGYGNWGGAEGSVWIRANKFFVPAFLFDSQTRPAGTQQNYGFFSYLNWSKSFYTTQGFSGAPQSAIDRVYFPKRRYDVKAHWKLPPKRNFVLAAGFTRFDMGAAGHGQIFDLGGIYYHKKWVVEGNLFVNRNQPGNLYSGAGSLAAQYGQEGKSWTGVVVGGGRELYRYLGQLPFDVRFNGYSTRVFYRKWLTRNVGILASFDYQDRRGAFQRAGGSAGMFFEF